MVVTVGTMVWMITLGDGAHEQMIRSSLELGLGSIQVHVNGYQDDKAVEEAILDPDPIIEQIRQMPGVEGVSVRLTSFGLISAGTASQGGAIIGVDPAGETTISIFNEKITDGEWLPAEFDAARNKPIAIGAGMANKLGVEVGDRLFLTLQRFTGDIGYEVYFVSGIFSTGMPELDKSVVYVPIDTLRDVMAIDVPRFGNAVHEVTVLLEPDVALVDGINYLKAGLVGSTDDLEILSWEEIQPGLRNFIDLDDQSMYIMIIFVFVIVAAGIMNTLLMAVFERIREFGILMSLGTRPMSIFKLVITESAIVGFIGAVLGLGFGLLAYWYNLHHPWSLSSYPEMGDIMAMDWSMDLYPTLIWKNVMKAVIGIFLITIIAGLWPAIKAALLKPVEALRHV